jgi:choline dehydrogenase-like flavoprotein
MSVKTGYDYVIVGGGSAGCVLANRLSEDGAASVLLIEAGGRDLNPLIHIPLGMGKMHEYDMFNWGYHTEPEPNMNGRRIEAMRGKVLGGSSSINVMAYTRGNRGDYDRWAQKGARGWSYADVLPYFKRCETWQGGADPWRGGTGPVGTEFAKTRDPLYDAWLEAAKAAGFPVTEDYNGRQQEGFGRGQYTIRDGYRSSAATAYLKPVRSRKNLDVETGAHATRVLMQGTRATGVEYVKGSRETVRVAASREVILAAGAFNTPPLLMLSGIGPAEHLRAMRVAPVVDLPVGKNLQDHLATIIFFERLDESAFRREMRFDRMAISMIRAYCFGTGPGTVVPGGLHAFVKTRPELAVPDIEFMFRGAPADTHLWFPLIRPAYVDGYGIRPTLLHPDSRGEILLRSTDPREPPRIVYNFFSAPDDLPRLREGFKRARDVAYQQPLAPYRGREVSPGEKVNSDAEIDAFIRRTAITAHHPCGTCAMGIGPDTVTDPQLRVRGIEGLRVADASVMPDLVSAHINACVLMIAEKASDLIRGKPALPAEENA